MLLLPQCYGVNILHTSQQDYFFNLSSTHEQFFKNEDCFSFMQEELCDCHQKR